MTKAWNKLFLHFVYTDILSREPAVFLKEKDVFFNI